MIANQYRKTKQGARLALALENDHHHFSNGNLIICLYGISVFYSNRQEFFSFC